MFLVSPNVHHQRGAFGTSLADSVVTAGIGHTPPEPGGYGDGEIRGASMPGIDSVMHEGFPLTHYNVDEECTPANAVLMTGRAEGNRQSLVGVRPVSYPSPGILEIQQCFQPSICCMACSVLLSAPLFSSTRR